MDSPAQAGFKNLLRLIHDELKPRGFIKRGQNFYIGRGDNIGVVNFQKSWSKTTSEQVVFTVNVSAWSRRLEREVQAWMNTGDWPAESACQFRTRIGHWIAGARGDRWWTITAKSDVASPAQEVLEPLLKHGVPWLQARLSDEAIRDRLLAGDFTNVHNKVPDLTYLVVLLKALGPHDQVASAERELAALARP